MTVVFINPGTGPVEGATLDNAYENMAALLKDAKLDGATFNRDCDAEEEGGRFSFLVTIPGYSEKHGDVPVDMPGIPLKRVRYTGAASQNICDFPRLYVDGSSWVWKFAVSILRDWVKDHEEAEEEDRRWRAAQRQGEGEKK